MQITPGGSRRRVRREGMKMNKFFIPTFGVLPRKKTPSREISGIYVGRREACTREINASEAPRPSSAKFRCILCDKYFTRITRYVTRDGLELANPLRQTMPATPVPGTEEANSAREPGHPQCCQQKPNVNHDVGCVT